MMNRSIEQALVRLQAHKVLEAYDARGLPLPEALGQEMKILFPHGLSRQVAADRRIYARWCAGHGLEMPLFKFHASGVLLPSDPEYPAALSSAGPS
jgi:hypothetical protein